MACYLALVSHSAIATSFKDWDYDPNKHHTDFNHQIHHTDFNHQIYGKHLEAVASRPATFHMPKGQRLKDRRKLYTPAFPGGGLRPSCGNDKACADQWKEFDNNRRAVIY